VEKPVAEVEAGDHRYNVEHLAERVFEMVPKEIPVLVVLEEEPSYLFGCLVFVFDQASHEAPFDIFPDGS